MMKNLSEFKNLIHLRGGKPLEFTSPEVLAQLSYDLDEMKRNRYDASVIEEHQKFNNSLDPFLSRQDFGDYLCHLTPLETYETSGVRLLPLQNIKSEIVQGSAPGGYIFPFGYLVFGTSIGGNALCFHASSKQIVWVDHDSFTDDTISYRDRQTNDWNYLDFSEENIEKAVVPLSNDLERFLSDLLTNQLTEQLDKLD